MEDEGDPLARGEPVEHDLEGDSDGVGERDVVGGVGGGGCRIGRPDPS